MASGSANEPFRFRKPDAGAITRVAEMLTALQRHEAHPKTLEEGREPDASGTLAQVIDTLGKVLEADYRKGLLETENQPWTFEYIVQRDEMDERCLAILTRLYHPHRHGSIFFGRRVRRVGPDEFLVWIDD
jgi:hypothetical protein